MIHEDIKTVEYRDVKPFYSKVFKDGNIKIKGKYYCPTEIIICFSNVYSKNRRQINFTCKSLIIGFGKPHWGGFRK